MDISNYDKSAQVLWKDRKRFMGMPLSFTRYAFIRREGQYAKLVNINGFLTSRAEEVNMYRVDDFSVNQGIIDKIFGVGSITVYCKDASCDKIVLQKVKNPFKVRELLNRMVLEDRARVGLRQSEIQY